MRGESEICSVWMSAWATPADAERGNDAGQLRISGLERLARSPGLCLDAEREVRAVGHGRDRADAGCGDRAVGAVGLLAPCLLGLGDAGERRDGEDERGSDENA